jgi:hypothetical protein
MKYALIQHTKRPAASLLLPSAEPEKISYRKLVFSPNIVEKSENLTESFFSATSLPDFCTQYLTSVGICGKKFCLADF